MRQVNFSQGLAARFVKTTIVAAMLSVSALAASAATVHPSAADAFSFFLPMSSKTIRLIPLQNGFTLHEYEDGKMAVENPMGRPVLTKEGQILPTANGSTIRLVGNELVRLTAEFKTVNHR